MATISAIARDWGTSRPYVSRCVHRRGCPTTSLEAAREWREGYATRRPPTNPKQTEKLLEDSNNFRTSAPAKHFGALSIDSVHDALEAAICAQEQAFCLIQEAIGEATDSKMAMLLAVHNKALELRLRAEAEYRNALKTCWSSK